jgi:arylformamidase
MKILLTYRGASYSASLDSGIPIALPMYQGTRSVRCFDAPPLTCEPVHIGDWVGSLAAGAPVNFYNLHINPHGNGTHTETSLHISTQGLSLDKLVPSGPMLCQLISVGSDDRQIEASSIVGLANDVPALVVRTKPSNLTKIDINHTGTNPNYFTADAMQKIRLAGVEHLLTDLPSVDPEVDGGVLAAHREFWQVDHALHRKHATITELIFVPDHVADGLYLLHLSYLPLPMDASPSYPVLYPLLSAL